MSGSSGHSHSPCQYTDMPHPSRFFTVLNVPCSCLRMRILLPSVPWNRYSTLEPKLLRGCQGCHCRSVFRPVWFHPTYFLPSSFTLRCHITLPLLFCDTRLEMERLHWFIASSYYTPTTFVFPEAVGPLIQITENTLRNTLGNNGAIENTGDAYINLGVLKVIMSHLLSARRILGYDDSKMYACAAVSSLTVQVLVLISRPFTTRLPVCSFFMDSL